MAHVRPSRRDAVRISFSIVSLPSDRLSGRSHSDCASQSSSPSRATHEFHHPGTTARAADRIIKANSLEEFGASSSRRCMTVGSHPPSRRFTAHEFGVGPATLRVRGDR